MAGPTIYLTRGPGWTEESWDQELPVLARASHMAVRGLESLGISYDAPKYGEMISVGSLAELGRSDGYAFGAEAFALKFVAQHGRPYLLRRAAQTSESMVHELIHCVRMEQVETPGFLERAATEGLAYLGAYHHVARFCAKQLVPRFFEYDLEPNEQLAHGFRQSLMGDMADTDEWFHAIVGVDMPAGGMYGVQRVHAQLQQGRRFADLLHRPADEVLGL